MGWAGMKCTPSGTKGRHRRTTAVFTEPTSLRIAPRSDRRNLLRNAEGADGRRQDHQIGIAHRWAGVSCNVSAKPIGARLRTVSG